MLFSLFAVKKARPHLASMPIYTERNTGQSSIPIGIRWGKKMQSKIEERGLLDPKHGFPQTNALDLMAYRGVFDLDYAMPIQREGGITLSLMTNGGEVEWLARDLLQPSTL